MRLLVVLSMLLAGCASFANTPAQERTYAQIAKCGGNTLGVIVAPDGSWQGAGSYDDPDNQAFVRCMGGRW